ncbi:hypothetical protein E2C01_086440 [Portunus trituberculatus]|uniref:Uncharacterized protein n=1 Tax=Portunus trituberculatus TaxID=210409 RepID=A0A5B7J9P6_PORTR|nr:hypothetical protein [Portunus trituberculatus]
MFTNECCSNGRAGIWGYWVLNREGRVRLSEVEEDVSSLQEPREGPEDFSCDNHDEERRWESSCSGGRDNAGAADGKGRTGEERSEYSGSDGDETDNNGDILELSDEESRALLLPSGKLEKGAWLTEGVNVPLLSQTVTPRGNLLVQRAKTGRKLPTGGDRDGAGQSPAASEVTCEEKFSEVSVHEGESGDGKPQCGGLAVLVAAADHAAGLKLH